MGNTHDTEIARIEADFIRTKYRSQDDYRWGYTGDRGPETWWVYYPSASGGNQSPIDIVTEDTFIEYDFSASNNPLQIFYSSGAAAATSGGAGPESMTLVNTGNTARVNIKNSRSYVTGGPAKEFNFVLEQFSLHWGDDDSAGSEHLVNSRPYAAELHLVHWNEDLYDNYDAAAKREDGILIIAVFITVREDRTNESLSRVASLLDDVAYRDQSTAVGHEINVRSLLPDDLNHYWTYRGSFTTPPCYETVTWIIFQEPIAITSRDLNKFRHLRTFGDTEMRIETDSMTGGGAMSDDQGLIGRNCRPVQPRGTRRVLASPGPEGPMGVLGGRHGHRHQRRTVSLLGRRGSGSSSCSGGGGEEPFRVQHQQQTFVRLTSFALPADVIGL